MLAAIVGGALGPWATGALYDLQGSYAFAFWICVGWPPCRWWRWRYGGPRRARSAVAGRMRPLRQKNRANSSDRRREPAVSFVTGGLVPLRLKSCHRQGPAQPTADGIGKSTQGVMLMLYSLTVCLGLLAAFCGGTAAPAAAYKWPGETAGLGRAISAKVIGQHCAGLLSASEIREVDAYLAKATSELATKQDAHTTSPDGLPLHERLMRRLAEIYAKKYADPTACDADTAEEAQD